MPHVSTAGGLSTTLIVFYIIGSPLKVFEINFEFIQVFIFTYIKICA